MNQSHLLLALIGAVLITSGCIGEMGQEQPQEDFDQPQEDEFEDQFEDDTEDTQQPQQDEFEDEQEDPVG